MKPFFLVAFAIFIYIPSIFAQSEADFSRKLFQERDSIIKSKIGTSFPDFTAIDLNEDTISEKQLIGKVTLLNFWFKGCAPCIAEFDDLNALYHKFSNYPCFQFLSFTSDPPGDASKSVQKFQLSYTVCPIERSECYRLNFESGFPTTIIINQHGKITFIKSGGSVDKEGVSIHVKKFEQEIAKLIEPDL